MQKWGKLLLSLFVVVWVAGCSNQPDKAGEAKAKVISLKNGGIINENIDTSFWISGGTAHAYFNYFVDYSGDTLTANDIDYIKITDPNNTVWSYNSSSSVFAALTAGLNNNYIGGYLRFYNGDLIDRIKLGVYNFEIKLKNGTVYTYPITNYEPGTSNVGINSEVCTEDLGSLTSGQVQFLKRATINSASKTSSAVNVSFSVSDSRVYNGYAAVYDVNGYYVGSTGVFRSANGSLASFMGGNLYNNGTANVISIPVSSFSFSSGKTIADAASVIVSATDGAQASGTLNIMYISRSYKFPF